jgi:hypothetical protein
LRDEPRRNQIAEGIDRLIASLTPQKDGLPVIVRDEHKDDRIALGMLQVIAMKSFFRELPCFLSQMLNETKIFRGSYGLDRLRWLQETSDEAVESYFRGAAEELEIPELGEVAGPHKLVKSEQPNVGDVWVLSP